MITTAVVLDLGTRLYSYEEICINRKEKVHVHSEHSFQFIDEILESVLEFSRLSVMEAL